MKTTEANTHLLEIERILKAPRDRVYAAWTNPDELRQWFGPDKVRTRTLTADARVGGTFRLEMVTPEGENWAVSGEYRELQPGRKIVFTWQWEDDEDWAETMSVVTIELSDCAGGTALRLKHESLPSDQSRERHTEGWTKLVDKLENYLDRRA